MTASALCSDFKGMGLQPPAVPTLWPLMGAAQLRHTMPFGPLVNPTGPQISQASNTVATLPSGFWYSQNRISCPFSVASKRCRSPSGIWGSGIRGAPFTNETSVAGDMAFALLAYMNSAVTRNINRNELAYTDAIHRRSRRAVHSTLRRWAGDSGNGAGCRRLASNRI